MNVIDGAEGSVESAWTDSVSANTYCGSYASSCYSTPKRFLRQPAASDDFHQQGHAV